MTTNTGPGLANLRTGATLSEYRVVAVNGALHSGNKIHDNDVAKLYGFAGGLVPGVTIYAYMTRPIMDALGLPWLERGRMTVRLLKPFYEGELVTVRSTVTASADDEVTLDVAAVNLAGETCAAGVARLGPAPAPEMPSIASAPLPAAPPPVSREALAGLDPLGALEEVITPSLLAEYLDEVRDDSPQYRGERAVVPSGLLIRRANSILAENVVLNPWIHVSSDIAHHGIVRAGEHLSTRGRITGLFERKGHQFVDMDILLLAGEGRPVMSVHHIAIYDVRKVAPGG